MTLMVWNSKWRLLAKPSIVALAVSHNEQLERVKSDIRAECWKRRNVGCIIIESL